MLIKLMRMLSSIALCSSLCLKAADRQFPDIRTFTDDRFISTTCDQETFLVDARSARESNYAAHILHALFPAFITTHPLLSPPRTDQRLTTTTVLSLGSCKFYQSLLRNHLVLGSDCELLLSHADDELKGETQIFLPSSADSSQPFSIQKSMLAGIIRGISSPLRIAPLLTYVHKVGYVYLTESPATDLSPTSHYIVVGKFLDGKMSFSPLKWAVDPQQNTNADTYQCTSLDFLHRIDWLSRYLSLTIMGGARNFAIVSPSLAHQMEDCEFPYVVIFHSADREYNSSLAFGLREYPEQGKFSANDTYFALLFENGVINILKCVEGIWSLAESRAPTIEGTEARAMAFSPRQDQLLVALKNRTMQLIDLRSNQSIQLELTKEMGEINDIFWREDGLITCVRKGRFQAEVQLYFLDTRTETPKLRPYKIKNEGEVNKILHDDLVEDFLPEPSGEALWAHLEEGVSPQSIRRIILPRSLSKHAELGESFSSSY